jgi:hypothetical protein
VPRLHSGVPCCSSTRPQQRCHTTAALQASRGSSSSSSHSSSRQAREKVVAFLSKDDLWSVQASAANDLMLTGPVHTYKVSCYLVNNK